LTNQLRRSATDLIDHYARRMLIENSISDGVDFFHMRQSRPVMIVGARSKRQQCASQSTAI